MSLNVKPIFKTMVADRYMVLATVDFDSSYPTGGEALSDADLGLNDDNLEVLCFHRNGYWFQYDKTNQKLLAYYADNNNASDGPAIEVPDTTSLATLTGVQMLAFGKKPA